LLNDSAALADVMSPTLVRQAEMAPSIRNIGQRTASAFVLAPVAIAATWAGGYWFLALMIVACGLLASEWALMSAPRAARPVAVAVGGVLIATLLCAQVGAISGAFVILVVGAAIAALFARQVGQQAVDAAYGVLYLGWPVLLLVWMRSLPDGLGWIVLVFAVAWSADVMAYAAGSVLKGPKLWPRFSPNKTWSGFVGGLMAGMAAGAMGAMWLDLDLSPAWGAALGLAAALATMAGDLWESALKRRFGVKDAGDLIPGHGGLLDRVDGLMFAVVVVAAVRLVLPLIERAG
jgi:phosphatidate cytidylyltransferase